MERAKDKQATREEHADALERLDHRLEQLSAERAALQSERAELLRATAELEHFRKAALEALYIRQRDNPPEEDAANAASMPRAEEPARDDSYRSQGVGLRVRVEEAESDVTKLKDDVVKLRDLLAAMQEAKTRATRGPRTLMWASVATLLAAALGGAADIYFGSLRWAIAAPALTFPFAYVFLLSGILPAQADVDRSSPTRYRGG